jgi:transposase
MVEFVLVGGISFDRNAKIHAQNNTIIYRFAFVLQILQSTIKRYVRKFREIGNVNTAIIGRPYNCISMHPHEELVIMEMVQQYPENTIPEILDKVYEETGSQYACSTLHYYLKRNGITRKKVGKYARGQGITQYYF